MTIRREAAGPETVGPGGQHRQVGGQCDTIDRPTPRYMTPPHPVII